MSSNTAKTERVATEQDLLSALMVLGSLPRRTDGHAEFDLDVFRVALEGQVAGFIVVAACDLASAIRRIVQGALGHAFHPSPSELRIWCDKVRDERLTELARHRRHQPDRLADRPPLTPEQRAHARRLMDMFKAGIPIVPGVGPPPV